MDNIYNNHTNYVGSRWPIQKNNKKIIALRWLPSSGKSTWAKEEVKNNWAYRFNKDDIRKELFPEGWIYTKANEKVVVDTERERVEEAFKENRKYIIIDNTHLGEKNKHLAFYKDLAEKYWYQFEIKDFIVSVEEAIKRDNLRLEEDRVGEEVIRRLAKQNWNKGYPSEPNFKPYNPDLPYCIICDIDWTIAFKGDRNPYDYTKVSEDKSNKPLLLQIQLLRLGWLTYSKENLKLFFLSWRDDNCKEETKEWLKGNSIEDFTLLMRKTGDVRGDDIVKEEIYKREIEDRYNVLTVFDDRQKVVDMWRSNWLPVNQARYWYF